MSAGALVEQIRKALRAVDLMPPVKAELQRKLRLAYNEWERTLLACADEVEPVKVKRVVYRKEKK